MLARAALSASGGRVSMRALGYLGKQLLRSTRVDCLCSSCRCRLRLRRVPRSKQPSGRVQDDDVARRAGFTREYAAYDRSARLGRVDGKAIERPALDSKVLRRPSELS